MSIDEDDFKHSRFVSVAEDAKNYKRILNETSEGMLPFGVSSLDDSMMGINRDDLALIGGKSGGGKTELAVHIGMVNALNGKKVYYLALEAHRHEIGMRILYKTLARLFYAAHPGWKGSFIAYDRWKNKRLEREFKPFYKQAEEEVAQLKNFVTRYIDDDYTYDDFTKDMVAARQDAKLIIIDHLHYFDLEETTNENTAYKKLVKSFKSFVQKNRIPIILVSHIRKGGRFEQTLAPDQEEFHGSSDIVKISTKAITISSAQNKKMIIDENGARSEVVLGRAMSFIKAAKYREGGYVTSTIALVKYDPPTNSYASKYDLGDPLMDGRELKFLKTNQEDVPMWALGAIKDKPIIAPYSTNSRKDIYDTD